MYICICIYTLRYIIFSVKNIEWKDGGVISVNIVYICVYIYILDLLNIIAFEMDLLLV
jgi:hypothetical protein